MRGEHELHGQSQSARDAAAQCLVNMTTRLEHEAARPRRRARLSPGPAYGEGRTATLRSMGTVLPPSTRRFCVTSS
jgi:hypothetical protein